MSRPTRIRPTITTTAIEDPADDSHVHSVEEARHAGAPPVGEQRKPEACGEEEQPEERDREAGGLE